MSTPPVLLLPEVAESTRRRLEALKRPRHWLKDEIDWGTSKSWAAITIESTPHELVPPLHRLFFKSRQIGVSAQLKRRIAEMGLRTYPPTKSPD